MDDEVDTYLEMRAAYADAYAEAYVAARPTLYAKDDARRARVYAAVRSAYLTTADAVFATRAKASAGRPA